MVQGEIWGAFLLLASVITGVLFVYEPARPAASTAVGGLDLAKYCSSYEFNSNDADSCSRKVPLAEACDWQCKAEGMKFRFLSEDLNSGICADQKGKDVGDRRHVGLLP